MAESSFTEEIREIVNDPVEINHDSWIMMVDGAVNSSRVGIGIIIISPNQQHTKMKSIKLDYTLSNN